MTFPSDRKFLVKVSDGREYVCSSIHKVEELLQTLDEEGLGYSIYSYIGETK